MDFDFYAPMMDRTAEEICADQDVNSLLLIVHAVLLSMALSLVPYLV